MIGHHQVMSHHQILEEERRPVPDEVGNQKSPAALVRGETENPYAVPYEALNVVSL